MNKPRLYLLVGYPGAGKTSVARVIQAATGAVHLWADHERLERYSEPTHSPQETAELYTTLNERTRELLEQGKSVIFDTNFNHRADRDHLRAIAGSSGATTILVWVNTPAAIAKRRAVHDSNLRNGYKIAMTPEHFDAIVAKSQAPTTDERAVIIDGSGPLDEVAVKQALLL